MTRNLRIILFVVLIILPIVLFKSFNQQGNLYRQDDSDLPRPKIAIIFDDLGESLQDLKDLYSLNTPFTISVIPNLKFSKNIAHIGSRCGFSVFIHLPLEPKESGNYRTNKYKFITTDLSRREIESLMRRYLNSIRIAIGVNNHMGSKATEDKGVMKIVLREIKQRGLIFVDSRTSLDSVGYDLANKQGLVCGYNEGFLDSIDDIVKIKEKMEKLILKAKDKGKIIVIAHPRKNTISFLKENLPRLRKKVDFITIKDYFDL
jgi:polysaccharide deacetylase 2 family uncharacterized protein YibQ